MRSFVCYLMKEAGNSRSRQLCKGNIRTEYLFLIVKQATNLGQIVYTFCKGKIYLTKQRCKNGKNNNFCSLSSQIQLFFTNVCQKLPLLFADVLLLQFQSVIT